MPSDQLQDPSDEDAKTVLAEWDSMRCRHPMLGEGMSQDSMAAIWEGSSKTYSEAAYGKIRDEIVDLLVANQYVTENDSMIDIGSGHGAFAIPLSRHVREIVCTDISPGMLARVESAEASNVRTVCTDCFDSSAGLVSDISFSSLCPPMNSGRGVMQMEKMARRRCIYISSTNSCPGIETEIWNALGEDYTYAGSNPEYPYRYLRALGRDPSLTFFSQPSEQSVPVGMMIRKMVSKLSKYRRLDDDSVGRIREVVESHAEDGIIHQKTVMTLGLLVWNIPSD